MVKSMGDEREERYTLQNILVRYARLLAEKPVVTKACTSAALGATGAAISQRILGQTSWRPVAAFAATGFVFSGPAVHYFHAWLEKNFPRAAPNATLKKLLVDRAFFCPSYLLGYLYLLAFFEGHGLVGSLLKISDAYLPALLINLKVWTPLQFLNIKYLPQQYRPLFMSIMALLWTVFIAVKRRQAAAAGR